MLPNKYSAAITFILFYSSKSIFDNMNWDFYLSESSKILLSPLEIRVSVKSALLIQTADMVSPVFCSLVHLFP